MWHNVAGMSHSETFDLVIERGTVFDGLGSPGLQANVGIVDGKIAAIVPLDQELDVSPGGERIDATGRWIMPGFLDIHTHYDAEVEVAPALSESLRHGVTMVMLGSCSLSLAIGDAGELADMYCRVEAIPDEVVRPILQKLKTWNGHREYLQHLETLPLGPHVASFVGHSAIRAHVMGIERSLEKGVRPTSDELARMDSLVEEGLNEGYVGLSIQTLPWDKMGGTRDYRSRPLPSTFATWSEYRHLLRRVRARGRIFQGVPNVSTKVNAILFMLESVGIFRKTLKTTIISMMDLCSSRGIHRFIGAISSAFNRFLRADFRWQALPEPFDLWADGVDLVVFEEFGAGAALLHFADEAGRTKLLHDPEFRARFRRQWRNPLLPKAFHRNLASSKILDCPEKELVGLSFSDVAKARGGDAVEVFLELVAKFGRKLRWYTMMANDRPRALEEIMSHPDVIIGFSDAGAHLRQMAHYNFPLRMLRRVEAARKAGRPFMSTERAVHRLTGEIGRWFGLDAGTLEVGRRADVVIIHPEGLTDKMETAVEAPLEGFGGYVRLVRRNEEAVDVVIVNGRVAVRAGEVLQDVGKKTGFGTVLRAVN